MVQAYAFTIDNKIITSMGNELLLIKNIRYILCWLLDKNINVVYAPAENIEIIEYLKKA